MSEKYIYEKDVSGDKKLESSLRKSINDWANGIPHHPYYNLGDKIKVISMWYKPAYPVRLRSQYEVRSKFKDHEPFTGQTIPTREYHDLSDFNSWDINLKKIKNFENSTNNYYVPGSQYVTNCHHCHATGSVTCHTCHGNKTIKCPVCHGARKVNCSSCGGHGDKYCSNCGGSGSKSEQVAKTRQVWVNSDSGGYYRNETYYETVSRRCNTCGGSGRTRCYTCSGTGKVTCSRCSGRGIITCTVCGGTGRLQCPVCKGETQLMHYFYIKRELEYTDKETCVINGDVYESFPEFLEEFSNYESKVVLTAKGDRLFKGQLPEGHHLNPYIDKFIQEADMATTKTHCRQFQQLDISCIDTWELRYSFKGKEYVMAFTGSQYKIIPGLSPVYEVAYNYWEKGVSAARTFMYSRASRLLTKSLRIDVFEIKDKVKSALTAVNEKLDQSYGLGSVITYLLLAFFGAFIAYSYYSEVNYVFGYVDFINNPENFLYPYHAWSQTIFSVFLVYLAFISSKSVVKRFGYHIPTVLLRVITGILFTVLFAGIFLVAWALLNATGISVIVTLVVWLAVKILWLIWWVIKIILGIVIFLVQIIWGILKWLWGLFF
jgi:hypothetical protein